MALEIALEKANSIVLEDPVWCTAIGILSGFAGLVIVWFQIRVLERSSFRWETVGLDWRKNSLLAILFGTILALLFFAASILTGYILGSGSSSLNVLMNGIGIPVLFQNFVLYFSMAFGEEIIFRGYVQTRLVERYGAIWGILITAVVFVLLHQISYSLSPIIILSGVMLWAAIGALYYLSKSLYLVILFHGVMNVLMNILDFNAGDIASMVVHALVLVLVIVVALVRSKGSGIHPNRI
jgi:membrane protease YdiL (CAAX protease family)